MSTLYLSRIIGSAKKTYGEGEGSLTINLPDQARDCERETCSQCGREHDALWRITRVPVGSFGHFTVYRLNAEEIVPDMSVPIATERIPRDAVRLSPAEAAAKWHDTSGSHVF